jgi:hypothetical protein
MGIDPIAMTNGMAMGGLEFGGAMALCLMLLGLLVGSSAGVLLSSAGTWRPGMRRLPRLTHAGRPAPLAGALK